MSNPFRTSDVQSLSVEPCVVVIFGASGDLTHRKLVPALYNLAVDGLLPANFFLVGFARRDYSDEVFRDGLKEGVSSFSRRKPLDENVWNEFAAHTHYVSSNFDDSSGYANLKELLDKIDQQSGRKCNRVFYLATAPSFFETISRELSSAGAFTAIA